MTVVLEDVLDDEYHWRRYQFALRRGVLLFIEDNALTYITSELDF